MNQKSLTQETRVFWFDAIRGISALLVCASHLRAAMFCDHGKIETHSFWHSPFYFSTGLGHQAVMVFFVLSGFFVGGSIIRNRHRFSWLGYSIARLSRLWTVLIPALCFTVVIDLLMRFFAPEVLEGAYAGVWSSGPKPGSYTSGLVTFLANIVFLQTILTPVFGSNGPLWSLANEFWYYAIFPIMMAIVIPRIRIASLAYLALAIFLLTSLPHSIVFSGIIFGLGILVYCLSDIGILKNRRIRWLSIPLSCIAFFTALATSKSALLKSYIPVSTDLLIGFTFSLLAIQLIRHQPEFPDFVNKAVRWLSEISYTLYLFHFPIVLVIGGVLLGGQTIEPTVSSLGLFCGCIVFIFAICHIAWLLFERNTDKVCRFMRFAVGGGRPVGQIQKQSGFSGAKTLGLASETQPQKARLERAA